MTRASVRNPESCLARESCHLKDRGFFVLVDRDYNLGILHPRKVLDRARNPHSHVKIRGNDLTGLSDLPIVGRIA